METSETLLRPIESAGQNKWGHPLILCECRCGTRKVISDWKVKHGKTRSCGCLQRRQAAKQCVVMVVNHTTHGESRRGNRTVEFMTWEGMRRRCRNPKLKNFKFYGGRGISVCDRWQTFENFLADMGRRPGPGHSLDRINNDGNYEPGNCRWATHKEQARNRRSNKYTLLNGERFTLAEAAEKTGKKYDAFYRMSRSVAEHLR
jgi:hypothetical protein